MVPVKVIVAGAGGRGAGYSQYALEFPDRMKVVGVAEPRLFYREKMAHDHQIQAENVFTTWEDMASRPKFADAVIIATQDAMHEAPAIEFARKGYAILLEKPMAPSADACKRIVEAVKAANVLFAVCHVMRYTRYSQVLKKLLNDGLIGDVVGINCVEPVGFWHMAHSFVRGNWRNSKESSFMLLAKSCHDLDWIRYMVGSPFQAVSSFGSLHLFRPEMAPMGAAQRCVDCPESVESGCPYSAKRIYIGGCLLRGYTGWPVNVLTPDTNMEGVMKALREGPYGRCVYHCDNDVVDHQVVNMSFSAGQTATFTMMAFTKAENRRVQLYGTLGELKGDGTRIEHYDFLSDTSQVFDTELGEETRLDGHGGGDFGLMDAFIKAVANNDQSMILSGADETLESHLMVFAAEKARLENRVVEAGDDA